MSTRAECIKKRTLAVRERKDEFIQFHIYIYICTYINIYIDVCVDIDTHRQGVVW